MDSSRITTNESALNSLEAAAEFNLAEYDFLCIEWKFKNRSVTVRVRDGIGYEVPISPECTSYPWPTLIRMHYSGLRKDIESIRE